MKVKIRKGDTVEVISGRLEDKGKRGEVINVILDDRRVVVQGVNIRIKHQNILWVLEWIITVIFTAEYILRIRIVKSKFRFIYSF